MQKTDTFAFPPVVKVSINHVSDLFQRHFLILIIIMIVIRNNAHDWHLFGASESKRTLSRVIVTN